MTLVSKGENFRVTGVLMDVSFLGFFNILKNACGPLSSEKEKKSGFRLLFLMVLVYKEKMDNKKYRIFQGRTLTSHL